MLLRLKIYIMTLLNIYIASTKIQNTFRDDTYLHTLGIVYHQYIYTTVTYCFLLTLLL